VALVDPLLFNETKRDNHTPGATAAIPDASGAGSSVVRALRFEAMKLTARCRAVSDHISSDALRVGRCLPVRARSAEPEATWRAGVVQPSREETAGGTDAASNGEMLRSRPLAVTPTRAKPQLKQENWTFHGWRRRAKSAGRVTASRS
jgi:hypothetical protein